MLYSRGKKKKMGDKILDFVLVVLLIFYASGIYHVPQYVRAYVLCEKIEAREEIHTIFSNGTTAPKILRYIAPMIEADIPRIPLVVACRYKNIQAIQVLLDNGADPNIYFEGGFSPLEAVLNNPRDESTFEIVQLLVEHGADVNLYGSYYPSFVQMAYYMQDGEYSDLEFEILTYLVEHGADLTATNYRGHTAYYFALMSGDEKLIELLNPN